MISDQLQRLIHATPFRPFTLRLADGQQLHVPHPDFITHAPDRRTAAITLLEADAIELVDLLLIVGAIVQQPANTSAT
jgi:hypothetical protein